MCQLLLDLLPPTLDCWPHSSRGLAYTVLLHIQSLARSWPIAGARQAHGGGTGEEDLPRPPARRAHLIAPHGEPVCARPAAQGATQSSRSPFLQGIRDILLENCQRWATCFLPNAGLDRAESLEELSCSLERPPSPWGQNEDCPFRESSGPWSLQHPATPHCYSKASNSRS